jgi:hypothetical protein
MNIRSYLPPTLVLVVVSACGGGASTLLDPGSSSGSSGEMTSGGMTSGEMTSGGMTSGEMTSGGMTSGGMTSGGMTSGGMTSGGVPDAGRDAGQDARSDSGTLTPTMGFFVTSTGSGASGGNLGGLPGADAKCQALAATKGFGAKTWKAYLSVEGIDARDRIGTGPWYNQKGTLIAPNLSALHASDIPVADAVDENGAFVPASEHDILTGSKNDGTSEGSNCNAWTSNATSALCHVGHVNAAGPATGAWNDAHDVACNQNSFIGANGVGRIYCFASN